MHIHIRSSVSRKDTTLLSMIIYMPSIFFLPICARSLKHKTRNTKGKYGGTLQRDFLSSLPFLLVLLQPFKLTLQLELFLPEVR